MQPVSRKVQFVTWGFLLAAIAIIIGLNVRRGLRPVRLPVYQSITSFNLTNQFNQRVTREELLGKVWMANIIFTRCPVQCLKMSKTMRDLKQTVAGDSGVKLVSLTADPEFDTPPVLKSYAQRFSSTDDQWLFLTGERREINRFAVEDLKLTVLDKDPAQRESPADLFIHSLYFVLIDKLGRARGIYEEGQTNIISTMSRDIEQLRSE